MATDPVCGMSVEERPSSLQLRRDNRVYYFCSESCLHQFAEPEQAQRRLLRQIVVAWPLALVVVVLMYAFRGEPSLIVAAALATVVQFYAGAPFYAGARDAIVDRSWNMDLLIAVGSTTAYVYSLAALGLPTRLPADYYFDASTLIIALILTGNYLEHRTRSRAGSALRRLAELIPEIAVVVRDDRERVIAVSDVAAGDRLRVAPGGRFPADGVVLAGRTRVDESLLTGEATPVAKQLGDRVLAGSVNGEGPVEVRATGVGSDTFLAEVGRLLTDAELSRVPLQRSADRIAGVFVPAVLALGLIGAGFWFGVAGAGVTVAVLVFVTVVITACPCAFGLATPAAILVGTGRAAEAGVLFRGEDAIERAARVTVVLTDKTGTLTRAALELSSVDAAEGMPDDRLLSLAVAVETALTDPYARALQRAASARGLSARPATDVTVDPGRGVRGTVDGARVEVVRAAPAEVGPLSPSLAGALDRARSRGESVSVVRVDGTPWGLLTYGDELAEGVVEGVSALAQDGIRVEMVTGDHASSAQRVAERVGIGTVHAGVTPAEKLEWIRRARAAGGVVAFVGDGINDAPALAGADLGVAIGSGTAVAREAGQVVLVRSDFRAVALALRIARRTVAKVRGNLAWAIGYNAVLLPIAIGALVPVLGLSIYSVLPVVGAAAMGLSSTSVLVNSLSLRRSSLAGAPVRTGLRATT
jgi:P-type Cu+ transporter